LLEINLKEDIFAALLTNTNLSAQQQEQATGEQEKETTENLAELKIRCFDTVLEIYF